MTNYLNDVVAFHSKMKQPILTVPSIPPDDRANLRRRLIDEEVNKELLPALRRGDDLTEIADGIADAIVVLLGTACEYGLTVCFDDIWNTVRKANLAKAGPSGPEYDQDGKVKKPEGWTDPGKEIQQIISKTWQHEAGAVASV